MNGAPPPAAPPTPSSAATSRPPIPRLLRTTLQILGFLLGIALLWWCAGRALAPENREQIERVANLSPVRFALLALLSAGTIALNGLIFWITIRPVRRLGAASVTAVNALATFLNYLPFKLSVLARLLIHVRRDGVPVLTVGAWFAAVAVVMLGVYAPLVGVSLWRRGIDAWWVAGGLGGVVVALGIGVALARLFARDTGRDRLTHLATRVPRALAGGLITRLLATAAFSRLHAGLDMLASWRCVAGAAALRVLDVGVQAARFVVAAAILSQPLSWQDATLIACTYFLIGVASPAGQLGTREAGTTWLAGVLGLAGQQDLAVVMLTVSVIESLVSLLGAGVAIAWLRPDRLIGRRRSPPLPSDSAAAPDPAATPGDPPADAPGPGPTQPDDR
ncbi:MAG: lysylphosphatidylglycerol synthase domain-containing protein [Phycisphaerales bacterium]